MSELRVMTHAELQALKIPQSVIDSHEILRQAVLQFVVADVIRREEDTSARLD